MIVEWNQKTVSKDAKEKTFQVWPRFYFFGGSRFGIEATACAKGACQFARIPLVAEVPRSSGATGLLSGMHRKDQYDGQSTRSGRRRPCHSHLHHCALSSSPRVWRRSGSIMTNYARALSPTKTRYRPATSEVNKQLTASKLCTQPARAAFNPAHTVNIDLTSALSFWPVRLTNGYPHVIPDLARLSLRKLAPRRGRCRHCAVRPERLDAELISVDLARRR